MKDKRTIKTPKSGGSAQPDLSEAFNRATKIGVYKELHKRGLISYQELSTLIYKSRPNQ